MVAGLLRAAAVRHREWVDPVARPPEWVDQGDLLREWAVLRVCRRADRGVLLEACPR